MILFVDYIIATWTSSVVSKWYSLTTDLSLGNKKTHTVPCLVTKEAVAKLKCLYSPKTDAALSRSRIWKKHKHAFYFLVWSWWIWWALFRRLTFCLRMILVKPTLVASDSINLDQIQSQQIHCYCSMRFLGTSDTKTFFLHLYKWVSNFNHCFKNYCDCSGR